MPTIADLDSLKAAFAARLASVLVEVEGERNVSAFARRTGIGYASITAYLNADSLPGLDKLLAIADATGRSVEWLATGAEPDSVTTDPELEHEVGQLIPVIGRVPAGLPISRALTRHAEEHVRVDARDIAVRGDTLFGLEVDGDSMMGAGILHGDIAICSMLGSFDVGDVVAHYSSESGESTVKQLAAWDRKRGRMLFQPHHADLLRYRPFRVQLAPDDHVRRVVAVVRRLPRAV